MLAQIRIIPLKLQYLGLGAPAFVAISRASQVSACRRFETPRPVKSRRKLISNSLVRNKAVLSGETDCLLVKSFSLQIPTFEARNFGGQKAIFVHECIRADVR